ncbi:Glypican-5 [Halotydeus destructor]|nr:Glypican-5 [Halotydeus destructor]
MELRSVLMCTLISMAIGATLDGHTCPCSGGHCCTERTDHLFTRARHSLTDQLKANSVQLKSLLNVNLNTFRDKFKEMIHNAKNDTLSLFEKKYPQMFNPHLITRSDILFGQLEAYILRTSSPSPSSSPKSGQSARQVSKDIKDLVKDYFEFLFRDMYLNVLNPRSRLSQYSNDFNNCLRTMAYNDISPFGETPNQLVVELEQSFDTSHALLESLALGLDVVNASVHHVTLGDSCLRNVVRIGQCSKCALGPAASSGAKACRGYCTNVFRGCLAPLAELDRPWSSLVASLERLSSALIGNHNAENVLTKIDIKIEEALLHSVDTASEINKRVRIACGHPKRYTKREVDHGQDKKRKQDEEGTAASGEEQEGRGEEEEKLTTGHVANPSSQARHRGADSIKGHRNRGQDNNEGDQSTRGQAAHHTFASSSSPRDPAALVSHRRARSGQTGLGLYVKIESFVHELKLHKNFYSNMADKFCDTDDTAPYGSNSCWNGHGLGEYTKAMAGTGLTALKTNPEFEGPSLDHLPGELTKLSLRLEEDAKKLNTLNFELFHRSGQVANSAEYFYGDGGAASGDGSGRDPSGHPGMTDDEDYNFEGSGAGGFDHEGSGHGQELDFNNNNVITDIDDNSLEKKTSRKQDGVHGAPGTSGSGTMARSSPVAISILLTLLVTIMATIVC